MGHLERWDALCCDLLRRLAECQGLGLGKEIGHQEIVVRPKRVQRLIKADKVAWDELGSLVDELIEGMLAVGSGLPPDNGSGLIVHLLAL